MAVIIKRPIGLQAFCDEVENTCKQACIYKKGGLKPASLIIPLDIGNGRSTAADYMAGMYKMSGVLGFTCGADSVVEVSFDGTMNQLRTAFAEISDAAYYCANNDQVIAMDISNLASSFNDEVLSEFMTNAKHLCKSACVLMFVHNTPNKSEERLIEKIRGNIHNMKRLPSLTYSDTEYVQLVEKIMDDHGVEVEDTLSMHSAILQIVRDFQVDSVTQAYHIAEKLIPFAVFTSFVPQFDTDSIMRANKCLKEEIVK